MLNAVVIENERPAVENLIIALSSVARDVNITACLYSVREGIEYLSHKPAVDLIFSNVQLNDGLSFEIFNQVSIRTPVIFITGYDKFIPHAFEHNGIDYIMKPLDAFRLQRAIGKYRMLSGHFSDHALQRLRRSVNTRRKKRMLVRTATQTVSLLRQDIVLFYVEHRSVYALDRHGQHYNIDKKMTELEIEMDDDQFFRANRQYLLNLDFVRGFASFEKVKIKVLLTLPHIHHDIIVSQETAPRFRTWMQHG